MAVAVRFITIPFSHYCEKARWALDLVGVDYREEGHLPMFHYASTKRAGAGRTVPVVVDGRDVLADSTDIVAWADRRAPGALLPADARAREEALALEDDFDKNLGPAARRVAYSFLLPRANEPEMRDVLVRGVPAWERRAFRVVRPLAATILRRSLNVTPAGVARSRVKIEETFATVAAKLADGRRYLAGDAFSVADLTLASLAAPMIAPPNHPFAVGMSLGPEGDAQREVWRATPAGQHVVRMYREHRTATRRAA